MSDVFALEQQVKNAKVMVELRDMALKLSGNREFKKLILDEYMVKECARYACVSADPNFTAEQRADALAMAQAPGHLKRWLRVIGQMGDKAAEDITFLEEAITEARLEEDQDIVVEDDETNGGYLG